MTTIYPLKVKNIKKYAKQKHRIVWLAYTYVRTASGRLTETEISHKKSNYSRNPITLNYNY